MYSLFLKTLFIYYYFCWEIGKYIDTSFHQCKYINIQIVLQCLSHLPGINNTDSVPLLWAVSYVARHVWSVILPQLGRKASSASFGQWDWVSESLSNLSEVTQLVTWSTHLPGEKADLWSWSLQPAVDLAQSFCFQEPRLCSIFHLYQEVAMRVVLGMWENGANQNRSCKSYTMRPTCEGFENSDVRQMQAQADSLEEAGRVSALTWTLSIESWAKTLYALSPK